MSTPIPATVISGFLGSGKTTLLNWLLHAPHGRRVAVVVNEFGAVGVDGALVTGGEQFVQLDNGCLCCALNEDLDKTLRHLYDRGGFDHLVLETTGIADPLPVAWTFNRPGLSQAYRVDAIVTVVDVAGLIPALDAASEARMQIERADILVLNKLDLVDDDGARAEQQVRRLNKGAPILRAVRGEVAWDMLLGDTPRPVRAVAVEDKRQGHHHNHAPSFESWAWETTALVSERALEDMVYEVPPEVYRFKGILRTDAEWTWMLVNAVAGRIDLRPHTPREIPGKSSLVFIGPKLDIPRLEALCTKLPLP